MCRELQSRLDGRTVAGLQFEFGGYTPDGQWWSTTQYQRAFASAPPAQAIYLRIASWLGSRLPAPLRAWLRPLHQQMRKMLDRQAFKRGARQSNAAESTQHLPAEASAHEPGAVACWPADSQRLNGCPAERWEITLDAGWLDAAASSKHPQARRLVLLYDLIPVIHPNYCLPGHVVNFAQWAQNQAQLAAGVLTISAAARHDIEAWLARTQPQRTIPVRHFHLGADYGQRAAHQAADLVSQDRRAPPFFLTVGTLELRKDHLCILEAFERRIQTGTAARLVVVGAPGFGVEVIQKQIQAMQSRGLDVVWFDRATDEQLAQLYHTAAGVVCASRAEGFGLPVVEGALYGRVVLAARTAVFEELASRFAHFFEPGSATELAQRMADTLQGKLRAADPDQAAQLLLTWDQAAAQFVDAVRDLMTAVGSATIDAKEDRAC